MSAFFVELYSEYLEIMAWYSILSEITCNLLNTTSENHHNRAKQQSP